jgi:hypothetical protein
MSTLTYGAKWVAGLALAIICALAAWDLMRGADKPDDDTSWWT